MTVRMTFETDVVQQYSATRTHETDTRDLTRAVDKFARDIQDVVPESIRFEWHPDPKNPMTGFVKCFARRRATLLATSPSVNTAVQVCAAQLDAGYWGVDIESIRYELVEDSDGC